MKTLGELRQAFWNAHHFVRRHGWTQNQYSADVRMAWCDFVEHCVRSGQISESLAQRATL